MVGYQCIDDMVDLVWDLDGQQCDVVEYCVGCGVGVLVFVYKGGEYVGQGGGKCDGR